MLRPASPGLSYYEILSVPAFAPAGVVRKAYRRLVQQHHPDRNPDPLATQRMMLLNEAYSVLSDPVQRQQYDASLRAKTTTHEVIKEWVERET
jgi:curved DNA-binding protein CbpA